MERNPKLYNASFHLLQAAKLLRELEEPEELIEALLNKAEYLKNQIVINQEELDKIAEYKEKIRS